MADKKISQLTGATTPLAGTEVLPIVQGGSTVKVSIANVTAGRSVATGPITASVADNGGISIVQSLAGETGFLNFVDSDAGLAGRVKYDHSNNSLQFISNAVEHVRIDSSGNVKNNLGNFIVGTAAKGVSFSENTPAAGMTSQLLNWYEEGTWTPQISSGATDATMGADNVGRYTRIGRVVFIHAFVQTSSVAGIGGGEIQIKNLPFAPNSGYVGYAASCGGWAANLNISAGQVVSFRPNAGATTIQILLWDDAAGTTNMTGTEWSDDGYVSFSLSYMI